MGRSRDDRLTASVATGEAEVVADPDLPGSYTLVVNGAPQSHVDLTDPTHLVFEYVRRMAAVIDSIAPEGEPLRVLHLGAGALTLPRYVMATRPGSGQRVVEVDGDLVDLVRRSLPWPPDPGLRVRVADARAAVTATGPDRYDLVVADIFLGGRTPAHVTSVEFVEQVARVLRPGGSYLVNVADGPPLRYARAQVATVGAVLPRCCLIADAAVLRGRRNGNLVLLAGRAEPPVPVLTRRAAGDWFPGRVLAGDELTRFVGGARPVTDAAAADSPPPAWVFGR